MSTVFMKTYLLPLKNIFSGFGCLRMGWLDLLNHSVLLKQGRGYLLVDMSLVSLYIYRIYAKIRHLQGEWNNYV